MKYNEFIALGDQLEKEGSSINEFVLEVTGNKLFESDEDNVLDTGGDTLKQMSSPRFAVKRKKLVNNAKDFLKKSKENILAKFMPKSLESLKKITNQAVALDQDEKNPNEIIAALKGVAERSVHTQERQLSMLEKAVDSLEANHQQRVDAIINDPKLSEKSKLKLRNFWTLLMTQVKQKIYKSIITQRQKFVEETATNNPKLQEIIDKMTGGENWKEKFKEYAAKTEEEKKKYQNTKDDKKEKKYIVGEEYEYTNKDNKKVKNVIIKNLIKIDPKDSIRIAFVDKPNQSWPLDKNTIKDRMGEKVNSEKTKNTESSNKTSTYEKFESMISALDEEGSVEILKKYYNWIFLDKKYKFNKKELANLRGLFKDAGIENGKKIK